MNDRRLRVLASIGLAVGGVLGMAGTFAPSASLRALAWDMDGMALMMAGALLTFVFYRKGDDLVASGFLVRVFGHSTSLLFVATAL